MNKLFDYIFDRKWLSFSLVMIAVVIISVQLNHFVFNVKTLSHLQLVYLGFITSFAISWPVIKLWAEFNEYREFEKEIAAMEGRFNKAQDAIQAKFESILERIRKEDNANH
jgi:hypothetical protein